MFLSILPILALSWISLSRVPSSLALTLQPIPDVSSLTLSASRTNKTSAGPASLSLDVPALAGKYPIGPRLQDPTCNGSLLGFNLDRQSCLEAWSTIPLTKYDVTFGQKYSDEAEVKLPRRYSGRKCSCLLSCLIERHGLAVHAGYPIMIKAHI